jgi:hypothetical protein
MNIKFGKMKALGRCALLAMALARRPKPRNAATPPPASQPGSNSSRRKLQGPGFPKELSTGPSSQCPLRHQDDLARPQPAQLQIVIRAVHAEARRQPIISQGKKLKQRNARLFSCTRAEIRRPAGPLIAIWGMESGFGRFTGNQHTMSAVATLAYDCRRSAFFTEQLYAQLQLIQKGWLSARFQGRRPWRDRPDPVPAGQRGAFRRQWRPQWQHQSRNPGRRPGLDRKFSARPWLARRRRLSAGRTKFPRHPGLERRRCVPEGDCQDRRRN